MSSRIEWLLPRNDSLPIKSMNDSSITSKLLASFNICANTLIDCLSNNVPSGLLGLPKNTIMRPFCPFNSAANVCNAK